MERQTGDVGEGPHHPGLTCAIEAEYPVAVIHVGGRLDPAGLPHLASCVDGCLAAEPDAIVLDVAELTVTAEECATAFAALSCQVMTWPGSAVVFACAPPGLVSAVRSGGNEIASYPSVEIACDRFHLDEPRYRIREELPPSPVAAPVARQLLGHACRSWSVQELLEPAELVTTELVANAVRHGGARVWLTVSLRQGDLQISVGDDCPTLPRQRSATAADEHGRGLRMVDVLCKDWGTRCIGTGKVVWARVSATST